MHDQSTLFRFPLSLSISLVIGVSLLFLGGIVLFGWHAHLPALIQIKQTFVPMQYNTSLCFLLSGVGLVSIALDRSKITLVCGLMVGLVVQQAAEQGNSDAPRKLGKK